MTKTDDKGHEDTEVIDFSIPLQGIGAAETAFTHTARKIAADPTAAADPNDAVDLLNSRNQLEANLDIVKVGSEMTQATPSLLA